MSVETRASEDNIGSSNRSLFASLHTHTAPSAAAADLTFRVPSASVARGNKNQFFFGGDNSPALKSCGRISH